MCSDEPTEISTPRLATSNVLLDKRPYQQQALCGYFNTNMLIPPQLKHHLSKLLQNFKPTSPFSDIYGVSLPFSSADLGWLLDLDLDRALEVGVWLLDLDLEWDLDRDLEGE